MTAHLEENGQCCCPMQYCGDKKPNDKEDVPNSVWCFAGLGGDDGGGHHKHYLEDKAITEDKEDPEHSLVGFAMWQFRVTSNGLSKKAMIFI